MSLELYRTTLSTLSFAMTIVLAFFFRSLNSSQRSIERAEKGRDKAVEDAKREVSEYARRQHELTDKLMDERFRALSHEVKESVNGMVLTVHEMKQELKDIDEVSAELRDRDQKNEIGILTKIDTIKDFIREHAASKGDLEKHESNVGKRFEKFDEQIGKLREQVATVSNNNPRRS